MPLGDREGPWGHGPMTGRSIGYCAGYPFPGFMNPGPGFGFGRGRGWCRGRFGRFWGYPYPPVMPYGYPFGLPYGYPFPYSYGYPYPTAPGAGYPASSSAPGSGQKK